MIFKEMGRDTGDVATRNSDQLACVIYSEINLSYRELQARQLTRRCAITAAMAAIIAPLLYGEDAR